MEKKGIERVREIMKTLRSEKGCPWDREQKIETLKPYIIEEAFEVVEAIDGDMKDLALSDNYFNIEAGNSYTISIDVISGKPIRERDLYVKALNSDAYKIY